MFGLPESTVFGKKIQKQAFYKNANVTSAIKRMFVDCIESITWQNKLSPSTGENNGTLAVSKGEVVQELEVLEIVLRDNVKQLSELLSVMDKASPHHALFVVTLEEESQMWIGYKDILVTNSGKSFNVTEPIYFHTEWKNRDSIKLNLQGISIDDIYENLIRYIQPKLFNRRQEESLKQCISRFNEYEARDNERCVLRNKMDKEIQINRKIEIKEQIKKLNSQIKELQS